MTDAEPRPTSRDIPDPIQRQVRQRCGFGCVICGLPLYEYDHLLGWANVHRHVASEITLLCDKHHREKGAGLLPVAVVEAANLSPHNLQTGVSKPYDLHYAGDECEAVIGGNAFGTKDGGYGTVLVPVSVDDTPLLAFILSDGHLMLNLNVFDEYNCLVLQIRNNQLIQAASPWDIQLVGNNLVVRDAPRKILVDIAFEPPSRVVINRGRFLRNGVEILVRADEVVIANNGASFSGNQARNLPGGVVIGPHLRPIPAIVAMKEVSRNRHNSQLTDAWISEEFGKAGPA